MKLTILLALLTLAALLLLARPVHGDTPVPPDGCSLPGLPPCFVYQHHVYMPAIARAN